jgi:2,4-dienoyl-CoA reductase-like NADH-dependent reductase (Old Yellow Enzyme family)
MLAERGVDLMDVSSGGNVLAKIPSGPGYQVPLAKAVRAAGLPVSAVGQITEPAQAQAILDAGEADAISLGRVALREPSWPLRAAAELDADTMARYPQSYLRGRWPAIEAVR